MKREHQLIKVHVPQSEDEVGHWIIALATFGVGRITEEDARSRAGSKFLRGGGRGARITETPKNATTIIRWSHTKEELVRSIVPARTTRSNVN